jgi:hypothetical protein
MSTLPLALKYSVQVSVPEMDDAPQWGFSQGYPLAYIKGAVRKSLNAMGYELVRLRQELDKDISVEVRSQQVFEKIIQLAARVEEHPCIYLIAHVRPL